MVIVLGGGLSGLSTAYYLSKKYAANPNLKLILLESAKRCGGWVRSDKKQDFIFEAGPRTVRPKGAVGANTLNMIEDLGLSDKVIPIKYNDPAAKNRLIYTQNKLHMLPSSLLDLLIPKAPFTKPLAAAILHDLMAKPKLNLQDDTIYNFFSRRFGKEIADYAISPMICGVFAGDAKELTVKSLFASLFESEQKYGSVIKGLFKNRSNIDKEIQLSDLANKAKAEKWNIYSLDGGLEQLPQKLYEYLLKLNIQVNTDHPVQEIKFYRNNTRISIKIKDGYAFSTDHLFSSIPSYELARLLSKDQPELSEDLSKIPFVDVAVVNLQYKSDDLLKQSAFGFLIPPAEKLPILGVIFDSCCFPNQKGTVLTAMMGGRWFQEYFGNNPTEEHLLEVALKYIKDILKIDVNPDSFKVNILRKCIPQYVVGHHDRVNRIRKYIKDKQLPITLCGSSFDGVGVNDVIMSARSAVENSKLQ